MRARQEYVKWCALESLREESRFGTMQERAYIAGFKRAVELAKEIIKQQSEDNHENYDEKV
jgi:hypothetical protein